MPISSFGEGLQKVVSFLPGTYGTSLVRNHAMNGVLKEMESLGMPTEVITDLKDSLDCNIYFFDNNYHIERLVLEPNGRIRNWPKGFFDQSQHDLAEIMRLGAGRK